MVIMGFIVWMIASFFNTTFSIIDFLSGKKKK